LSKRKREKPEKSPDTGQKGMNKRSGDVPPFPRLSVVGPSRDRSHLFEQDIGASKETNAGRRP